MKHLISSAKLLSVVALALGPVAILEMSLNDHGAAYAEKSNGNGNSGGNGKGGNQGKSHDKSNKDKSAKATNKGDLASELKGMNAVRANPNALLNADPNSQVGRIATYRDAALATAAFAEDVQTAKDRLITAQGLLATAEAMPINTQEQIDARNTAIEEATDAIADATTELNTASTVLSGAEDAEEAALMAATGGRTLSDEALAYVRSELGL
jgi:hypothetical protein